MLRPGTPVRRSSSFVIRLEHLDLRIASLILAALATVLVPSSASAQTSKSSGPVQLPSPPPPAATDAAPSAPAAAAPAPTAPDAPVTSDTSAPSVPGAPPSAGVRGNEPARVVTETPSAHEGRFEFGSYGRVYAASDLRGGTGRATNVVAFGPRIVDEGNYAELELRREDRWNERVKGRVVATLALFPPFFHFTGKPEQAIGVRNLYAQGTYDNVTMWAGSRMYRGDDIYLLNWWPLDNQNTIGGGAGAPIYKSEGLETIQCIGLIENLRVKFNCRVSSVNTSATAGRFLVPASMRCAVSPEKKTCVAASGGFNQREPMRFPFQDRSTIMMWPQSTIEERVAIKDQMMGRDRGTHQRRGISHELHAIPSRHMFDHHTQSGKLLNDRGQLEIDEDCFTVKHVDVGSSRLGMHK